MITDRHTMIFNRSIKRHNVGEKELQKPDSEFTRKRRLAEKKLDDIRIEREYKTGSGL